MAKRRRARKTGTQASASRDVIRRIDAFNAKRNPKHLELKYRAMRADSFEFFRGTAHLFWEDWARARPRLNDAPLAWSCGDAHLENFGTFRGDNRLVYFDINDFDEAGLAPATADLVRLLASVHVAARSLHFGRPETTVLGAQLLDSYAGALADGKARWVERATARGMVRDLLRAARDHRRRDLVASRTTVARGRRRIRLETGRTEAITAGERTAIKECVQKAGAATSARLDAAGFFDVLDVAARIAGLSSLGLRRYVVLVRGRGGANGNYLLDLKEVRQSSMVANLSTQQPRWRSDAERVVHIQRRMQAVSPALLTAASIGRTRFVLRELQPTEDRLALHEWNGKIGRLRKVIATMGQVLAWAQLRSASRAGAASADALIELGHDASWRRWAVDYAKAYTETSERYWREFGDRDA